MTTPQKPTPGRIVLFHYFDVGLDKMVVRPAIVTSLPEPGEPDPRDDGMRCNLHVFFEPHDVDREAIHHGEVRPHRSGVLPCHPDPFRPATPGTWSWPPRV